jgi:hypothetical protein
MGGQRMTKFIQMCASQNNLFALDEEGNVYQYHFNVKTWVKLATNREQQEERP